MARGTTTLAVVGSPESVSEAGGPPPAGPSPAPPPHAASASPVAMRRPVVGVGAEPADAGDSEAPTSLTPTRPGRRGAATPSPRTGPESQTRRIPVRPSPRPRGGPSDTGTAVPRPVDDEDDPRTTTVARSTLAGVGPPTAPHTAVTVATPVEGRADTTVVDAHGSANPRVAAVDVAEAEEFLRLFHDENPAMGPPTSRLAAVRDEIAETGTYVHTSLELEHGARVAWRNSARCIGRLYWRSLHLRDRRDVADPEGVADECVAHLRDATRRGRVRSTITVFAPDTPSGPGPRVWNEQLVRYAGYRAGGAVLGDPRYVGFTDTARSLGWMPPSPMGGFDVLPLVVSGGGEFAAEGPHLAEIPADAVLEVPLSHPDHEWFAELGLQWHAVPAISNMRLDVGGVSYPAAPFNGWYMATEIGARNLADPERYDLLGEIGEAMGLDTSNDRTMWRDRAAVELTLAVQHSFDTAGVTLADHHGESQRFLRHVEREEAAGRSCPVDWSWIVPPISGGLTPVFHRYYDEPTDTGPMFRLDDTAKARGRGCPV